jgi:hypothetical protein
MTSTVRPGTDRTIVVVGHGAAGLSAALGAAEAARERRINVQVTVIERAPEADRGGNSRWSPSNLRMRAPEAMDPGFVDEIIAQSGGRADRAYFERLAADAPATARWLRGMGVEFDSPPYYLSKGPARIMLGSDMPFPIGDPAPAKVVRAAAFSEAQRKCILGDTAQGVFRVRADCWCPR